MKKSVLLIFCIVSLCTCAFADSVFSHKISAENAAKKAPVFESACCKFSQQRQMKSTNTILKSGGNFKFIKDKGVVFETTYPIQSTASYTSGQNKIVNRVIKAITNKYYSYLEKNFDIYNMESSTGWVLALKPRADGQLQGEMKSIQIFGTTTNGKGLINKIIIDTTSIKTTQIFTDCK